MRTFSIPFLLVLLLTTAPACTTDESSDDAVSDGAITTDASPTPYDVGTDFPEVRYLLAMSGSSSGDPATTHVLVPEFVEEECLYNSCANNTAPVLGDPIYEINGELFGHLVGVRNGDHVRVLFPYEDAECNLACGMETTSYVSPESSGVQTQTLPSNIPCDTASSDTFLGVYVGIPSVSPPTPGRVDHYEYDVRLDDICGARAEFSVDFDVVH